jgi:hypothetical protein
MTRLLAPLLTVILTLAATVLLPACAVLTGANQTNAAAVQTAVELSVSLYIQQAGPNAADQTARAQKVKVVATELQGLATGTLTVAQFQAQLATAIAKLNPSEQILANAILLEVDLNLSTKVQNGILDAAAKAAANVVLGDVLAVCAMYGA